MSAVLSVMVLTVAGCSQSANNSVESTTDTAPAAASVWIGDMMEGVYSCEQTTANTCKLVNKPSAGKRSNFGSQKKTHPSAPNPSMSPKPKNPPPPSVLSMAQVGQSVYYGTQEMLDPDGSAIYQCAADGSSCNAARFYSAGQYYQVPALTSSGQALYALISGDDDKIVECASDSSSSCTVFSDLADGNYSEGPLLAAGKYIFVAGAAGKILRCTTGVKNSCADYRTIPNGESLTALAAQTGTIYYGTDKGNVYSCSAASATTACTTVLTGAMWINSLAVAPDGHLYVGRESGVSWGPNGLLLKCTTGAKASCVQWANPGTPVNVLQLSEDGSLFAALDNGVLWKCSTTTKDSCLNWATPQAADQLNAMVTVS